MQAIIDITRANSGTERKVIDSVIAKDGGRFTAPPIVVEFDGQREARGTLASAVEYRSAGGWRGEEDMNRFLADIVRRFARSKLCRVYSFYSSVLAQGGDLASLQGAFEAAPLREYVRSGSNSIITWPEELMPVDEAVRYLENGLRQAKATRETPVLKTDLRPMLTLQDRRFNKASHPASALPGLISVLIDEAAKRGIVEFEGADPGGVLVWLQGLADTGPPSSAGPPGSSVRPGENVEIGQLPATPLLMPSVRRSVESHVPTPFGRHDGGTVDSDTETPRSEQFQTLLRNRNLGVFPEVRRAFYAQLMVAVNEASSQSKLARKLVRDAIRETKADMPNEFKRPATSHKGNLPKERYAWKALEEFTLRVLARAGLLVSPDGSRTPDVPWLTANAEISQPLPCDFVLRLDAEMVFELVREFGDIGWSDRANLAGAILDGRSEDLCDEIEEMVSLLAADQRIGWDESKFVLRVHEPRTVPTPRQDTDGLTSPADEPV